MIGCDRIGISVFRVRQRHTFTCAAARTVVFVWGAFKTHRLSRVSTLGYILDFTTHQHGYRADGGRFRNYNHCRLCMAMMSILQMTDIYFTLYLPYIATVVPALGDPRRERTPAMYGHVINVPTHFNIKLPAIGGHLPNADADSHLLVVRTCYNGQFKQMPRFWRSFQPKIARGGHPNLRPTFCSNVHAAIW